MAVPDAPAVLLHVELPRHGLVWDGAAGTGVPAAGTRGGSLRIASNTKTFVAATLLLLSERGRVELDASAARWLRPSTAIAMGGAGLRVRQPETTSDRLTISNPPLAMKES